MVSDTLTSAVEALVALNYDADRLTGSANAALLHPALAITTADTTSNLVFAHACLPFLGSSAQPSVCMLVPARQVAGAS